MRSRASRFSVLSGCCGTWTRSGVSSPRVIVEIANVGTHTYTHTQQTLLRALSSSFIRKRLRYVVIRFFFSFLSFSRKTMRAYRQARKSERTPIFSLFLLFSLPLFLSLPFGNSLELQSRNFKFAASFAASRSMNFIRHKDRRDSAPYSSAERKKGKTRRYVRLYDAIDTVLSRRAKRPSVQIDART